MTRFSVLALVVAFLAVAGVGLAARSSGDTSVYGLVNANGGRAPSFQTQGNMSTVRRVKLGRYCLLASVKFDNKPIAELTTDLSLSGGRPGIAILETASTLCHPTEVAVVTYEFTAGGRLRLSNAISFAANPEG